MDPHPAIERLSFLLGTWSGRGDGEYPTIEPFSYTEEVVFAHAGKAFVSYSQRTRDATSGEPLHSETGYIRPVGTAGLELVVAQPTGIVEIHEGEQTGSSLAFRSTGIVATPTAKEVDEVHRTLRVEGDTITYEVSMAAAGLDLRHHLSATLSRTT